MFCQEIAFGVKAFEKGHDRTGGGEIGFVRNIFILDPVVRIFKATKKQKRQFSHLWY